MHYKLLLVFHALQVTTSVPCTTIRSDNSHPRSASLESSVRVRSERFVASSPSSVGPLFAGSRSPDACVPFLPVPVPGVFVLATSADVPAPPASEPPPPPTTNYMTTNITWIQHCTK